MFTISAYNHFRACRTIIPMSMIIAQYYEGCCKIERIPIDISFVWC